MSVNVNNILGTVVPDVYIKNITLSNLGQINEDRNPHIDHIREPGIIYNTKTHKLEPQMISPDYDSKQLQEKSLSIRVDLVVREQLANDLISTWFGNRDFMKYLHVCIIQSIDPFFSDGVILFTNGTFKLPDGSSFSLVKESKRNKNPKIVSNTIALKDIVGDSKLDNYDFFYDSEGNKIYNITFSRDFYIEKGSNLEHLSYFAVSYLNADDLAKDYNLDIGDSVLSVEGKISAEIVISDHEVKSESYSFYDKTGNLWNGPVHQINTTTNNPKWRSGQEETISSIDLEIRAIPNNKVQDFRDVVDIERLQLNFSMIENNLFSAGVNTKFLTNDELFIKPKNIHVSEFVLSRETDGSCRFFFVVDFLKMIKENTLFGKLYRQDNEELLDNVRIRSMRIKRVRVKEKGIPDYKGNIVFNSEDAPEYFITSGEDYNHKFANVVTKKGAIRETCIAANNSIGMRFFTGVDYQIKDATFGLFRYGVELEIEDGTIAYLYTKLDRLLTSYTLLEKYYNESIVKENFDVVTQRFTRKFIEEKTKAYSDKPYTSPWVLATTVYLSLVDILFENINIDNLSRTLISFVSPRTGNPNGIKKVLDLMRLLADKLAMSLKTTLSTSVSAWKPGQSQYQPTSVLQRDKGVQVKTFTIEAFSENMFDTDLPKSLGYDYISITPSKDNPNVNKDGLKVVSVEDYQQRVNLETQKYFTSPNANINIQTPKVQYTINDNLQNSMYGFLSPSFANFGTLFEPSSLLKQGTGVVDFNNADLVQSLSLISNFSKQSPYIPSALNLMQDNLFLEAYTLNNSSIKTNTQPSTALFNPDVLTPAMDFGIDFPITTDPYKEVTVKPPPEIQPIFNAKPNVLDTSLFVQSFDVSTPTTRPKPKTQQVVAEVLPTILETKNIIIEHPTTTIQNVVQQKNTVNEVPVENRDETSRYVNTEILFNPSSSFVNTELIEEEMTSCDIIYSTIKKSITPEANALMKTLSDTVISNGIKSSITTPTTITNQKEHTNTIENFNLLNPTNAIDSLITNFVPRETFSYDSQFAVPVKTQQYIMNLPNQIKSLLLDSTTSGLTVKNWFNGPLADKVNAPKTSALFDINYNMLREIEYLESFGLNSNGEVLLKEPVWKTVNPQIIESLNNGASYLLRSSEYTNKKLGISPNKGMQLPIENEYFILAPTSELNNVCERDTFKYKGPQTLSKITNMDNLNGSFTVESATSFIKPNKVEVIPKQQNVGKVSVQSRTTMVNQSSVTNNFQFPTLTDKVRTTQDLKIPNNVRTVSISELEINDNIPRNLAVEFNPVSPQDTILNNLINAPITAYDNTLSLNNDFFSSKIQRELLLNPNNNDSLKPITYGDNNELVITQTPLITKIPIESEIIKSTTPVIKDLVEDDSIIRFTSTPKSDISIEQSVKEPTIQLQTKVEQQIQQDLINFSISSQIEATPTAVNAFKAIESATEFFDSQKTIQNVFIPNMTISTNQNFVNTNNSSMSLTQLAQTSNSYISNFTNFATKDVFSQPVNLVDNTYKAISNNNTFTSLNNLVNPPIDISLMANNFGYSVGY